MSNEILLFNCIRIKNYEERTTNLDLDYSSLILTTVFLSAEIYAASIIAVTFKVSLGRMQGGAFRKRTSAIFFIIQK